MLWIYFEFIKKYTVGCEHFLRQQNKLRCLSSSHQVPLTCKGTCCLQTRHPELCPECSLIGTSMSLRREVLDSHGVRMLERDQGGSSQAGIHVWHGKCLIGSFWGPLAPLGGPGALILPRMTLGPPESCPGDLSGNKTKTKEGKLLWDNATSLCTPPALPLPGNRMVEHNTICLSISQGS